MRTICQAEQFLLITDPFIFFRKIYVEVGEIRPAGG